MPQAAFRLSGGCPAVRTYDKAAAGGGAIGTHIYKVGTTYGGIATVMNRHVGLRWNTIGMQFNWFDIFDASGGLPSEPRRALASKILTCVLPGECIRTLDPSDLPPGEEIAALPKATALYQNVPNPFNPVTTIEFDLAQDGHAALRVYDISGRLVRALVDAKLPRRRHSIPWNALDDHGLRVASGVYLYRLETEGFSATRKLVVLK